MIRRISLLFIALCTFGFIETISARTIFFDLNVYPQTASWEVVAHIDGDEQDGLAGFFFQLTDNVVWFEHTAPVISTTEIITSSPAVDEPTFEFIENGVGFDFQFSAPFPGLFEIGAGQVNFLPEGAGFLFDVGNAAGGHVPNDSHARNVPWSDPVVLAVGGYDPSMGTIDFTEGGDPPFTDASLFFREDDGSVSIIAADGSVSNTSLDSVISASSLAAARIPTSLLARSRNPSSPTSSLETQDPLVLTFNSTSRPNINGPREGSVDEWLANGAVPEPSGLVLFSLAVGCVAGLRRYAFATHP